MASFLFYSTIQLECFNVPPSFFSSIIWSSLQINFGVGISIHLYGKKVNDYFKVNKSQVISNLYNSA